MTPAAPEAERWLRCPEPNPSAPARIVCFGPAGAAASFYRRWGALAGPDVEVWALALPGRESRIGEPALETMDALAGAIAALLAPLQDRPTLLFGHSMGASVAHEVTRRLEAGAGPGPAALVVSARPAPPYQRARPDDTAGLTDAEILARLRRLGGTPAEVLDDAALRDYVVAPCRTDFELLARYRPAAGPRIRAPLWALYGDRDDLVRGRMHAWTGESNAPRGVRAWPGGHFFCLAHEEAVVAHVAGCLAAAHADDGPRRSAVAGVAP